jgi:hypothetical protein
MEVGLSPNPYNAHGESLVHMVSRRCDAKAPQIMVDKNGCNLSVADDYGRTPLHDCCWAADPAFEVADISLAADPRMFDTTDSRGADPTYVRKEHWPLWIEYLESKKDMLWPRLDINKIGEEGPPALTLLEPTRHKLKQLPFWDLWLASNWRA